MRASVERGLGIALFVLSGACSGGPSGSASGTDNGSGDSSGTSGTTAAATSGSDATGSDGGTNTGSSSTSGSGTSGSTSSGSTAGESGSGSSGTGGRGVCGDEVLDPGEACDDGVFGSVTCDPDCTPASCGDGTVNEVAGESCDDGNAVTEDGCEPDCTFTTGIKSLVGSSDHFCANNFAGEVQCWGISFNGCVGHRGHLRVGDDELPSDLGPVSLMLVADRLFAGVWSSCAISPDDYRRCWGSVPTVGAFDVPSKNPGMANFEAVDLTMTSYFTCRLLASGVVECAGGNGSGELGQGNQDTSDVYLAVDLPGSATAIAAGVGHTCAILQNGDTYCWGRANYGQLGLGSTNDVGDDETPNPAGKVELGQPAVQISAGGYLTCALLEDNSVRCWGSHTQGGLGLPGVDGPIGDDDVPLDYPAVDVGATVEKLVVGTDNACVITPAKELRCWGLGRGTTLSIIGDDEHPSEVPPLNLGEPITHVVSGNVTTCVLTEGREVRCFGSNEDGGIGNGIPGYFGLMDASEAPVVSLF